MGDTKKPVMLIAVLDSPVAPMVITEDERGLLLYALGQALVQSLTGFTPEDRDRVRELRTKLGAGVGHAGS